jgi:predicted lipid-binding transport protein (Tim44 family)
VPNTPASATTPAGPSTNTEPRGSRALASADARLTVKRKPAKNERSRGSDESGSFILIGSAILGLVGGLTVGLLQGRSLLFMQAGGVAGIGLRGPGLLAQAGWRRWRSNRNR